MPNWGMRRSLEHGMEDPVLRGAMDPPGASIAPWQPLLCLRFDPTEGGGMILPSRGLQSPSMATVGLPAHSPFFCSSLPPSLSLPRSLPTQLLCRIGLGLVWNNTGVY